MPRKKTRTLADLWDVFDRGDHLTDGDLKVLIASAEAGLRYLRARGERLSAAKTAMDLARLEGYRDARKRGGV